MGFVVVIAPRDDYWAGRVVLVTGAAGFVGTAVARELRLRGAVVVGLDNNWGQAVDRPTDVEVERVDGDVRDIAAMTALLMAERVDTVVHLAARSLVSEGRDDPVETFSTNVAGTWSVLEACRAYGRLSAIVVASSDKAYGDRSGRPYDEGMALRPRGPYEVSKAAADMIARSYAHSFALPVAVTRCGNLYGGGDTHWSRIVPGTVRALLRDERPVIRSDGSFVRDYLHVADAARGIVMLAAAVSDRSALRGKAFNFADGTRLPAHDLVQRIAVLMGSDLQPVVLGRAADEIREQRVSAARARRELGWRPRLTLDEGLNEAIAWYRRHLGAA